MISLNLKPVAFNVFDMSELLLKSLITFWDHYLQLIPKITYLLINCHFPGSNLSFFHIHCDDTSSCLPTHFWNKLRSSSSYTPKATRAWYNACPECPFILLQSQNNSPPPLLLALLNKLLIFFHLPFVCIIHLFFPRDCQPSKTACLVPCD